MGKRCGTLPNCDRTCVCLPPIWPGNLRIIRPVVSFIGSIYSGISCRGRIVPWKRSPCMQLVEHLNDLTLLMQEAARLLKPGGRFYVETPHPKSLTLPSLREKSDVAFTLNFYDDPSHLKLVSVGELAQEVRRLGMEVSATGTSRNWLFATSHLFYFFMPPSRKKYTAWIHWLGWSAYLIARRPL